MKDFVYQNDDSYGSGQAIGLVFMMVFALPLAFFVMIAATLFPSGLSAARSVSYEAPSATVLQLRAEEQAAENRLHEIRRELRKAEAAKR